MLHRKGFCLRCTAFSCPTQSRVLTNALLQNWHWCFLTLLEARRNLKTKGGGTVLEDGFAITPFQSPAVRKKKSICLKPINAPEKLRTLVRIQQIGSTFYSKTPVQWQFWLIFYNTTTKGFHPTLTKVMCIWHGHRKRLGPGHQLTNETEPVHRITQQNTYSRKWGCSMLCHWQHLTQAPELWMCSLQVNCRHTIHLRVVFLSFFQLQTRHRPLRGPMGEDANSMLWWRAVRTKQYAELPTQGPRVLPEHNNTWSILDRHDPLSICNSKTGIVSLINT